MDEAEKKDPVMPEMPPTLPKMRLRRSFEVLELDNGFNVVETTYAKSPEGVLTPIYRHNRCHQGPMDVVENVATWVVPYLVADSNVIPFPTPSSEPRAVSEEGNDSSTLA